MYHARLRPGTGRSLAGRVFQYMGLHVQGCAHDLVAMKGSAPGVGRRDLALAHPDDSIREFLSRLGSDAEGLEPCEVALFEYLRSMSNTAENRAIAAFGGFT